MSRKIRLSPSALPALGIVLTLMAADPMPQPLAKEGTVKISDHIWAVMGFPNIAIIVGDRATLVVDTGLALRNGATAARVAASSPGVQSFS